MFKRIFPIVLALILLAAHFFRNGNIIAVIITLFLPLLLFVKQLWVIYLLQAITYMGAVIWGIATYTLAVARISAGQPWTRMVLILAAVMAFTIWAAYWLKGPLIKEKYK